MSTSISSDSAATIIGPSRNHNVCMYNDDFKQIARRDELWWTARIRRKILVYIIHGLGAEGVGAEGGCHGGCEGGPGGDECHSSGEFILRNSPPPEIR